MSDTVFTVITIGLGIMLGLTLVALLVLLALVIEDRQHHRRRRRARANGETEPPESLEAFGVDISVWPSRAPRNGASEEASA